MGDKEYIKIMGNIYRSDIDNLHEQDIGIVLVRARASDEIKQMAEERGIRLYDDISYQKVDEIRKIVHQLQ